MKQFDEIFAEKVKEAFSNYNAAHLADKGWKSFIARRNKRLQGVFFIPLWAKAASVLLLIAAGTVLTYKILNRQDENKTVVAALQSSSDTIAVSTSAPVKESSEEGKGKLVASTFTGEAEKKTINDEVITGRGTERINNEKTADNITGQPFKSVQEMPVSEISDPLEAEKPEKPSEDFEQQNALIAEALKKYLEADSADLTDITEKTIVKKSAVMAGVSGMMAVIDNVMASAPGVAAGFYYEHQFSKRISVRPGVAIAMHTSSLENSTGRSDLNYAAPLSDGTSGSTDSYDARLRLVALELPINMVFKIVAKEKSSFFLAAGASTMVCLNQKFTGTFLNAYTKQVTNTATGEATLMTNYSTVEVEKTEGAFSHADLFGLANLSAGYYLPFGKNNILIEPYVQVPLSSITSLNVKIFYSGMSVKMRFGN